MKFHLISIVCIVQLFSTVPAQGQVCSIRPRLITVTGTAEVNVAPDEVVLNVGVESRDKDLAAAKSQHDSRVKKTMAETRDAGVTSKDIQTSTLQMSADYSEEKVPRFLAYEVTQTIVVTLKDLSKYESLMTMLLENGVNRINSVNFLVADDRKYKDEARLKAIRAAKEKATAMAAELGQTIGKPWEITENSANANYFLANANTFVASRDRAPEEESTVAPGEVTIRASVNVSFQLE
jgi:uncharacterized protein YggE